MSEADDADAAWVEAEIPLPPPTLLEFLADPERLWRLNPCLVIDGWRRETDGFALRADNEANGRRLELHVRRQALADGFRVDYDAGLKRSSEFRVSPRGDGSLLRVVERYDAVDGPDDPRTAEADKSLVPWIAALRRHLVARKRWGGVPGWRWWSERFMLSMPPRQRRIVRLIVWVTVAEFVVFVAAVVVLRLAT